MASCCGIYEVVSTFSPEGINSFHTMVSNGREKIGDFFSSIAHHRVKRIYRKRMIYAQPSCEKNLSKGYCLMPDQYLFWVEYDDHAVGIATGPLCALFGGHIFLKQRYCQFIVVLLNNFSMSIGHEIPVFGKIIDKQRDRWVAFQVKVLGAILCC